MPDTISAGPAAFAPRLVALHDGRRGIRGGLEVEVRPPAPGSANSNLGEPAGAEPILEFIASNEALDRSDEVVSVRGWQLENYRRNPVFQNAHQYGDVIHTLGRARVTEVREIGGRPVLFQQVEFAVSVNPMARVAYGLYRGGFLNAVSVGFIPLRWVDAGDDEAAEELGDRGDKRICRRRYLEQELLEVSAVGIPANPDALRLGLKAGCLGKADLADMLDFLLAVCPAALAPVPTRAEASSISRSDTEALFQLARNIKSLMARQ